MEDIQAMCEMPRYRCHKVVWALKIKAIDFDSASIIPEEEGYGPIEVGDLYLKKQRPEVGGYYVVYKDGYKSFSPAVPFEEGYTRI